jgi:hypothetical protein
LGYRRQQSWAFPPFALRLEFLFARRDSGHAPTVIKVAATGTCQPRFPAAKLAAI